MSFTADLRSFASRTKSSMDESARAIKIELFNGVIRDTRVDTGRLRGNWQTSVGTPAIITTERTDAVPQGSDGGVAQDEVINTVQGNTVDYLSNNLPYAEVWEERDGMIARNLARVQRNIKAVIRGR